MRLTTARNVMLLAIAIASGTAAQADPSDASNPAHQAIWRIIDQNRSNQASAVAIGTRRALTNAHVLYDFVRKKSTDLKLTRGPDTVEVLRTIAISATYDLALLETATPMRRYLRIARTLPLGRAEQFHLAGYPKNRFATLRATQEIGSITRARFDLPMERVIRDGFSGGAVLAPNNEIVGIHKTSSDNLAGVIPAATVLEFFAGEFGVRCESRTLASCVDKATMRTRMLAKDGNADAQYQLGRSDRFIPGARDMDLLKQAAMQGNPDAQHELGNAYDSGTAGLRKDLKKAAYWSERAARQGESAAQVNTSIAYHYGAGVVRDTEVAMTWLDRAVKSGDAGAEYNLGVVYQYGDGRPQDLSLARYWLELAAERGIEEAKEALAKLEKTGGN